MTVETAPRPVVAAEDDTAVLARARSHAHVTFAQGAYIVWYRDIIRYWRDRTRVIGGLAQPLLFLVVFGVGLSSSFGRAGAGTNGFNYQQFVYPGTVGMAVLFTALFSAMSMVWDREFGFLREILVSPVSRTAVAVGKVLGGATQAMLQGVVMLVLAPVVGVHLSVLSVIEVVPLLFVLACAMTSFGIALAARITSMQGFQVVMNFTFMPMFFLSGALFPLQGVPAWMQVLTHVDPVAYGMAPVRWALLNGAGVPGRVIDTTQVQFGSYVMPPILDVLVLLVFAAAMLTLAMVSLRRRD